MNGLDAGRAGLRGERRNVDATARIEAAFRDAGVTGRLHAADIDTGREVGVRGGEPMVLASVFKVPLLVAFYRSAAAGLLDPTEPVTLRPGERSMGPTGVSAMLDEVRMSLRDLACLMITVSDNAAADALLDRVGIEEVNATSARLGLPGLRVETNGRDLHAGLLADSGAGSLGELWGRLDEPGMLGRLSALDPARTSRGTPAEMTRLLGLIWRDEAAPGGECAAMRRLFGLQVWPHRLSSGFPYDDVLVSGKTGTLLTIRNEVGVVEYPDGGRYAVAVSTRSLLPIAVLPQADAVIGTAARIAVESLRRRPSGS
ncbi:serine hydrolase [Spirillospora sp. NBC_01491]|uniref:serine hydrolase n=1 Tax=Spirillospora sp. NBC_01491 TaxID=2976007 RepID=UPI002E31E2FD|nr:serine hydrolase [Spirillospora sp. NBC_01491]